MAAHRVPMIDGDEDDETEDPNRMSWVDVAWMALHVVFASECWCVMCCSLLVLSHSDRINRMQIATRTGWL